MKIIKFNAVWCPGCLVMKSRWKKVCNEIPNLDITNYDYDIDTDMVKKYNIGKILSSVEKNDDGVYVKTDNGIRDNDFVKICAVITNRKNK